MDDILQNALVYRVSEVKDHRRTPQNRIQEMVNEHRKSPHKFIQIAPVHQCGCCIEPKKLRTH